MSAEENKAIVRRLYEEVLSKRNLAATDEVLARDYVEDNPPGRTFAPGLEGAKQVFAMLAAHFPPLEFTIEDQIAEGDKVVTRWTARGIHTRTDPDETTSDAQVTFSGIDVHRVVGGKIVEHAGISDNLGVLQQLGGLPPLSEGGG